METRLGYFYATYENIEIKGSNGSVERKNWFIKFFRFRSFPSCSLRARFNRRQFNFTAATFTSPISASFVALRASIFYFGKIKTSTIRGREKLIRTPTRLIELYRRIVLIVAAVTR